MATKSNLIVDIRYSSRPQRHNPNLASCQFTHHSRRNRGPENPSTDTDREDELTQAADMAAAAIIDGNGAAAVDPFKCP
jgi:hypothetical protein